MIKSVKTIEEYRKTEPESQLIHKEHSELRVSPFGRLFRFIGWWFGFTGLYATFAVCPFCGQQGCPVGIASAGTIGAFFALCIQDGKLFFAFLRQKLNREKGNGRI
jgi:hypothetical protein